MGKPLLNPPLHNVLQVNHAENLAILRNHQRSSAAATDLFGRLSDGNGEFPLLLFDKRLDRLRRPFSYAPTVQCSLSAYIDAAHAGLRAERNKRGCDRIDLSAAQAILFLRKDGDGTSFRCLVGQRSKLGGIGKTLLRNSGGGDELRRHPVSERHRPRLVEQKDIDVPRRLDGPARRRYDVVTDHAVHPRNADGGEKSADGRRDQTNEKCHEHGEGHRRPLACDFHAKKGKWKQGHADRQEDDRECCQKNVQRNLIRSFLALRPLDEMDHPIKKPAPRLGRQPDDQPIRQDPRAAGDRAPIPSRFPDHRRAFPGNGALVDRSDSLDHFTVGGDNIPRLHEKRIPLLQHR